MKKIHSIFFLVIMCFIACKKSHTVDTPVTTEKKWIVTTIAGGIAGFQNGPALTAKFHFPSDIVVTPDGAIYVTDVVYSVIRKIFNGQVTTLAGGSGYGIVNGNGTSAQFKDPYSIGADADGNLYTTDGGDARIRRITSTGNVFTFTGSETAGYRDGDPDSARFNTTTSIVADPQGNIYVSEGLNRRIRKVSASGQVSTIAGTGERGLRNGDAAAAQFDFPGGIAIDRFGNLYVLDRGNFCIRKMTPAGIVSTFAGSGVAGTNDGGPGEAQFSSEMHDIVADQQGNLFVSDDHRIRKISPEGSVITIAGSTAGFVDGDGPSAKFYLPFGLGIDAQGNLYVSDFLNSRIRKIVLE
jgi:sugar lactone lactonase YvrE